MRTCIVLFCLFPLLAGSTDVPPLPLPPGTPPIDSEDEAIQVASEKYFVLQSCVSEKFEITAEESDTFWTVTSRDTKPIGVRPCHTMIVHICKESGALIHEQPAEHIDSETHREAEDVDQREDLILAQVPQSDFYVIPEHGIPRWN